MSRYATTIEAACEGDAMNDDMIMVSREPVHPGEFLREDYMPELGLTVATLAKRLGGVHMSAQAVGGAVGHNPISIIVPCHRVVGTNGSLTGYAGGLDRKIKLLEIEQTDMTGLFRPTKGKAL